MRRKKHREELLPDLTPLMDIMFLLLIFFIVTSVFRKDETVLSMALPKTEGEASKAIKGKSIVLELTKKDLAVNKKVVTLDEFSKLATRYKNPELNIDFRVDKDVVYDRIVKVLNILQKNNLTNLSLVTNKI